MMTMRAMFVSLEPVFLISSYVLWLISVLRASCSFVLQQSRQGMFGGDEVADKSATIPSGSYVSEQSRQTRLESLITIK